MDRKGAYEAIAVLTMVVALALGAIGASKAISENRYVGDTSTLRYYDLKYCSIADIAQEHLKGFENQQQAEDAGFSPAKCVADVS